MSFGQFMSKWKHVKVNRACDFCKMDKTAERAVIQYLHKKGLAPKAIHADRVATLGKDVPPYATVKDWVAEFKHGRDSLEDCPLSGRPVSVATPEIVTKV